MDDAVVVGLAGVERKGQRRGVLREQARPGPAREREDEEVSSSTRPSASIARTSVPLPLT
jgi:hypothetical protein